MKLSVSAYRAHASAHKKILTNSYQQHYGSTSVPPSCSSGLHFPPVEDVRSAGRGAGEEAVRGERGELSAATSRDDDDDDDSSNNASSESKSPGQRTRSNQRWMKLRTTVQLSSAIQKKPPLKREDSFLKRFSTRQIPETQETVEDTGSEGAAGEAATGSARGCRRRRTPRVPRTVVNPDENFYFYWLWLITVCVLYNMWTLIVRQSFPELQIMCHGVWVACDALSDAAFALDLLVQLRTGYLEQGLMVYDARKLARHYMRSRAFLMDLAALTPLDLLQLSIGTNPMVRFPRFLKVYRAISCYYMVESRTVYPNFWRVINLIHILLILAHWFGCFYFLLSESEGFQGDWVYPHRPGDYATLTRKYLGSLYWSTLTLTTIGDLPTPETNAEYVFTIVSYLIGVFIFATIVGQVGNVITNRNANRLEFERLLDGAKTYMRHHKVPGGMKRRVLRWYDYSWSRGRIQGGGDINTALGLLPDKLKTELALHVNLSVLKKVTIFQECQPEFLHDLVLKMKAYIFTPGDSICRKGEVAREMFIIADGILEVISETGRVLTTMKAGDFFGEIGILNLDGLNKRTADVRSVGYSELFSLSREDVLAAMKDYPEAQDILQTLGRKRLQEARSCSRHHRAKGAADSSPERHAGGGGGGDESAPKRIVHRLRSDVKGIRNALRSRSRTAARRSAAGEESLELHTLSGTSSGGGGGGGVLGGMKGMLRRMPRVESDEYHAPSAEETVGAPNAGGAGGEERVSPLGAGLPLLQRLKLLKERQDREERAAKQRASASSVVSGGGGSSAGGGGGGEVIGAGLPLIQRLMLLKAREERERQQLSLTQQHSSSDTISPSSLKSPLSPAPAPSSSLSPACLASSRNNSSGSSDGAKPKVSFKDKIVQVCGDGTAVSQPLLPHPASEPSATFPPSITIPNTVVNKIKSPAKSAGTTFRERLKLLQPAAHIAPVINPSLPPAPSVFCQRKEAAPARTPWGKLKRAAILGDSRSNTKGSVDSGEAIPTAELVSMCKVAGDAGPQRPSISLTTAPPEQAPEPPLLSPSELVPKSYDSIADLSPEYANLPFVKQLKILNERQKLAELESAVRARSSSLDCASSSEDLLAADTLVRSHSEGSAIDRRPGGGARPRTDSPRSSLSTRESNETLERRTLKSILKKLTGSDSPLSISPRPATELRRLHRAPTLEGYAVRHSKFAKSVTFDRHTLPSPPAGATAPPLPTADELHAGTAPAAEPPLAPTPMPDAHHVAALRPQDITVPEKPKLTLISAVANQRKLLRGSLEEQEYFGEVLLGIKHVIQGHLHDVQGKFQERFDSLEQEVRKRDEIISQLQRRILELERSSLPAPPTAPCLLPPPVPSLPPPPPPPLPHTQRRASSASDDCSMIEFGFMRGDSLDTVFATSPPGGGGGGGGGGDGDVDVEDTARLERLAAELDLGSVSYAELRRLATRACCVRPAPSEPPASTYSRRRAARQQRRSWEERGDRDELAQPQDRTRRHHRRPACNIKKTLSVDAGMHRTGRTSALHKHNKMTSDVEHRKFSLGLLPSLFGYHRGERRGSGGSGGSDGAGGGGGVPQRPHDVVLDMPGESLNDSGSSTSSESEVTPRYEELRGVGGRGGGGAGADWELVMLAEELDKRERERARQHHLERVLRDLEEESDTPPTPQREDSAEAPPPPPSPRAAPAPRARAVSLGPLGGAATAAAERARAARGAGVILRAASLDGDPPPPPPPRCDTLEARARARRRL